MFAVDATTMGKGKAWDAAELRVLAVAYANATHNPTHGADQKNEVFLGTLMTNIRRLAPAGPHPRQYENRGDEAIYVFIRDHLKPEMNKFNIALRTVLATEPTGVSEEQKFYMAIAIHLKKTNRVEYKYRDQNPYEWRYYDAWKVLRTTSKFRMPQAGAVHGRDNEWNVNKNENASGTSKTAVDNETALMLTIRIKFPMKTFQRMKLSTSRGLLGGKPKARKQQSRQRF